MDYSPWADQMSIMFVDEDSSIRKDVKQVLEAEGYKVLTSRNSVEALVLAADYPFSIDILFTGMDTRVYQNGLELAACFRILRPETRIVLTAGLEIDSLPARISEFDTEVGFLSLPFTKTRLIEAIDSVLAHGWKQSQAA